MLLFTLLYARVLPTAGRFASMDWGPTAAERTIPHAKGAQPMWQPNRSTCVSQAYTARQTKTKRMLRVTRARTQRCNTRGLSNGAFADGPHARLGCAPAQLQMGASVRGGFMHPHDGHEALAVC